MSTNIIFKDKTGQIKGSVNTHHNDEPTFIRALTADNLAPGDVFAKFGAPGDSITVENGLPVEAEKPHGAGKLEKLCSGQFADNESGSAVTVYRIVDEALMVDLDLDLDAGNRVGYEDTVLSILGLENYRGEVAPGALYTTYDVERINLELVSVIETVALNV